MNEKKDNEKEKFKLPSWMHDDLWEQCVFLEGGKSRNQLHQSLLKLIESEELKNDPTFKDVHQFWSHKNEQPFPNSRTILAWIPEDGVTDKEKGIPRTKIQFINLLGYYIYGKRWNKVTDRKLLSKIEESNSKEDILLAEPRIEISDANRKRQLENKPREEIINETAFINKYFDDVDKEGSRKEAWDALSVEYKEIFSNDFDRFKNGYDTTQKHISPRQINVLENTPTISVYEILVEVIDLFIKEHLQDYHTFEDIPWLMIWEYYRQKGVKNNKLKTYKKNPDELVYNYIYGYRGPITRKYKKIITIQKDGNKLKIVSIETTEISIVLPGRNI